MTSEPTFHAYTAGERRADAAVHVAGLVFGLLAAPTLVLTGVATGSVSTVLTVGVYAASLLAMLSLSAAYNMTPASTLKAVLRRLDHSAIFVLIAGTYTPFAHALMHDDGGPALVMGLWVLAAIGVALSVFWPRIERWVGVPLALLMGWSIVLLLRPLITQASEATLALLIGGGVLYTVGVGFHLAKKLKYHNAIWHLFVLAAAACHALAVLLLTIASTD